MKVKILLTGSSGFFGKTILRFFSNYEIISVGRTNSDINCDLSVQIPNLPSSDLVIHAAGKAHMIPKTDAEKQAFFDVNVRGTHNLLKGLDQAPTLPKTFLFLSSVSVYGLDKGHNIIETQSLDAKDPYGQSKIQAERLITDWCEKNNVICTILRLPLSVGRNPPGNLGSMITAIKKGYYLNIAGGKARKSMVMAEDVAKFILPASKIGGVYNLTDRCHPSFNELSKSLANQLNKDSPLDIPIWLARIMARVGDLFGGKAPFGSYKLSKITADLTFDDEKARKAFGWNPQSVLEKFKIKD